MNILMFTIGLMLAASLGLGIATHEENWKASNDGCYKIADKGGIIHRVNPRNYLFYPDPGTGELLIFNCSTDKFESADKLLTHRKDGKK